MSTKTHFGSDLFNQIFENQFGYQPLRKDGKLLKDSDVSTDELYDTNLSKLQIMGYIPYVVDVLENHPKPSFREVLRRKGTQITSCSHLRMLYKHIGFIDFVKGKMVKGKNYQRLLTTKWDWFVIIDSYGFLLDGSLTPKQYERVKRSVFEYDSKRSVMSSYNPQRSEYYKRKLDKFNQLTH